MAAEDLGTTVSMWICLVVGILLIVTRVILRVWRGQLVTRGDHWCIAAAVFILIRVVANHFLVLYGSTRTLTAAKRIEILQPGYAAEYDLVVRGSQIILVTRTTLVILLWCLKMAVLDLLGRLISKLPYERAVLASLWIILALTFGASIISIFVGCQPFRLYWQINPDPGDCVIGNLWLLTYEICNILTDAFLLAIPIPLVLSVKLPAMQRLRILSLFSIGIFLIAISIIRILQGKDSRSQRAQTLWASLEVVLAVIVAVTPSIYALVRNRPDSSSYATNPPAHTGYGTATIPTGTMKGDQYTARAWTELPDRGSRKDDSSMDGILIETRYETTKE